MTTILYVFPHPDDESFGIGQAIARQAREGHAVHLLTLTKGGATKVRHDLGFTVEQMGAEREKELRAAARTLGVKETTVLDFPDSGLKEMDPRTIEAAVSREIVRVKPSVVVTYAVHGISGFHDHLVTYAAVKRAFVELKSGDAGYLKRLAFFTVSREKAAQNTGAIKLQGSTEDEIDCIFPVEPRDIDTCRAALDCYVTYRRVLEESKIKDNLADKVCFEFFGENVKPPAGDLSRGI